MIERVGNFVFKDDSTSHIHNIELLGREMLKFWNGFVRLTPWIWNCELSSDIPISI